MHEHRPHLALLVLVLGCSTSRAAPRQEQAPAPAPFEPIRFGDPAELTYDAPFFPGLERDESIPTADSILGARVGSRIAHHAEILACFRAWAAASPRIRLEPYGTTHEGRELLVAVISAPENLARLDAIRADLGTLADPRGLSAAEAERIVRDSPAAAWLGYSIHGDETSGSDAALVIADLLVAGRGEEIERLLEQLVVVIDPCLNPDGRERILALVEQSAGRTPNLDWASMQRGRWPFGRGNHYLFDMNRDWMAGTQPETRGRWAKARSFHPQLFVDAHEMWSLDTFLFYPQNRPLNPHLPPKLVEWQRAYAEGAARAFDAQGWSYYSREWADAWGPFYSDAWGSLLGATGMLYEQASTSGFPLRRGAGEILTYREAVHHQAVASRANLETLAARRAEALRDALENARRNVDPAARGNERALVVLPGRNADREEEFLRILSGQGIEVFRATAEFQARDVRGGLGASADERSFPAGAWIVPACQPLRSMVRAYLDFDTRMELEDLRREREELERKGRSRVYDVTAWSLPLALDLDAWWCTPGDPAREPLAPADPARGGAELVGPTPAVAWLVSAADDASVAFAARALEGGLAVGASDEAFSIGGPDGAFAFPAGSFLVRRAENGGDPAAIEERVLRAAREAGLGRVVRSATGLSPDAGPDLGGQHFDLLARPRVALVGNSPIAEDTYGHLWFLLDAELGVPFTLLDAQSLGAYDLRRYNVLVLPPHQGGLDEILEENEDALRGWLHGGGILIACGSSAASLTSGRVGLSQVTLREDALENLTPYRLAAERERAALSIEIDEEKVWGTGEETRPAAEGGEPKDGATKDDDPDDPYAAEKVPAERESWLELFSPQGIFARGVVDPVSWIARGSGPELAVFVAGSDVLLSKPPVRTAVRLSEASRLRLSVLLWPEARERLAESAWLTVERVGNGAIVLFAETPGFRGYHRATARLFANAVVLGPGLGANPARDW
jgi:hypothetical protein